MCARAATAQELIHFRTEGQSSRLFLVIHQPRTVFSCRLNGELASNNQVVELTYDGASGTYTDVIPGMTLYVGSSAGASDKGIVRIRKAATATTLYVAETSVVQWADDDYLTIVEDFRLVPRRHKISGNKTTFIDWDVGYSDQNKSFDPIPVLGGSHVLWLTDATVTHQRDASASYLVDGSAISAYQHTAAHADEITDDASAVATIAYAAASGHAGYLESCKVTSAGGKSFTGHRHTFVFDAAHLPISAFRLGTCRGDWNEGGWSFEIALQDEGALSSVRDHARVVLFAQDYYGDTQTSIGPLAGSENVVCEGWIDGQSIRINPEQGEVTFTVHGPHHWLSRLNTKQPFGVKNLNGADPKRWEHIRDLTLDKGLWELLHTRTTATQMMDVILSGDEQLFPACESQADTVWQQLQDISENHRLVHPVCDRYGRLFIQMNPQYWSTAARAAIPTVMTLTKPDLREEGNIERVTTNKTGFVSASGIAYDGTLASPARFSKAPGDAPAEYGGSEQSQYLFFSGQAELNELCGMIYASENNEYPSGVFRLSANNRLIDIAPAQYLGHTMAAADTVRGIAYTDKNYLPRRIEYQCDSKDGGPLLIDVEVEGETSGPAGKTYVPEMPARPEPYQPPTWDEPDWPILPPPHKPWKPPVIPVQPEPIENCTTDIEAPVNRMNIYFDKSVLRGSDEEETERTTYAFTGPAYVRSADALNTTFVYFPRNGCSFGNWENGEWVDHSPASWVHVYALDRDKKVVLTGSKLTSYVDSYVDGWRSYLVSASALEIAGIKVVIDEKIYSDYAEVLKDVSVPIGTPDGVAMGELTVEQTYMIETYGGPWYNDSTSEDMSKKWNTRFAHGISGWSKMYGGAYYYGTPTYFIPADISSPPDWAMSMQTPDGYYIKLFFKATTTSVSVGIHDSYYTDNHGEIHARLHGAVQAPGTAYIAGVHLCNICPV